MPVPRFHVVAMPLTRVRSVCRLVLCLCLASLAPIPSVAFAQATLAGVVRELVIAARIGRHASGVWLLSAVGLLSIAFGGLLLVYSGSGILAVVSAIGVYAIVATTRFA